MAAPSPPVQTLLASYPIEVRRLAMATRAVLHEALPAVEETADAAAGIIGYGFGPGYKGTVCTIILSKSAVKLAFVRGSELPDPKRLLGGRGKVHRYMPITHSSDLQKAGVQPLLKAALAAWIGRTGR
jgi:hypothetical protein